MALKTIFITLSKGKELEGEFTTLEQAQADLWANDYYLGTWTEEKVELDYFQSLLEEEHRDSLEDEKWGQLTTLEKYRLLMSS